MRLRVLLDAPMRHAMRAFIKDRANDPLCSHQYPRKAKHNVIIFTVQLSTCGMQKKHISTVSHSYICQSIYEHK